MKSQQLEDSNQNQTSTKDIPRPKTAKHSAFRGSHHRRTKKIAGTLVANTHHQIQPSNHSIRPYIIRITSG